MMESSGLQGSLSLSAIPFGIVGNEHVMLVVEVTAAVERVKSPLCKQAGPDGTLRLSASL